MEFQSQSQAGQDRFAFELIGGAGTFIDIGAGLWKERSNTHGLEQIGWTGWLMDMRPELCRDLRANRASVVIEADANCFDWNSIIPANVTVDYLSLDVDASSLGALKNVLGSIAGFRVATIEHDHYAYKDGESPRSEMAMILTGLGYDVLCADIANEGMNFEIWAVDPRLVDMRKAERFRRCGITEWREFWK